MFIKGVHVLRSISRVKLKMWNKRNSIYLITCLCATVFWVNIYEVRLQLIAPKEETYTSRLASCDTPLYYRLLIILCCALSPIPRWPYAAKRLTLSLSRERKREWGGLFTNPDHRHFLRIRAIIFIRKFALIHLKLCHMYFILPVIFRDLDNSEPLSLTSFILEDSKFSLRKKLWKNKQPGNINKVMHFKKDNDWTRLTKINTFSRPRNYTIEDHTGYPYRKIQSSTSSYANNKLVHMWFTHRINKLDDKRR